MQPISDVISIESQDTFRRPIYAGNIIATVRSHDAVKLITVRATAFDAAIIKGNSTLVEVIDKVYDFKKSEFIRDDLAVSERPELTSAKVVISGGRGMENLSLIHI